MLIQAAETGDTGAVNTLLAEGADINEKNSFGDTALMRAAASGHLETVRLLIEKGASVNAQRGDGMTPLMRAAFFGHVDVVQALADGGAEVNVRDRIGMTALDWARSRGETAVVKILTDPKIFDAQASASYGVAEQTIISEDNYSSPKPPMAVTDELVDDILDLPGAQETQTPGAKLDHTLQSGGNPLSLEPATELTQYELSESSNSSRVPPAAPPADAARRLGEGKDSAYEITAAGGTNPTNDKIDSAEVITQISLPKGSRVGRQTHFSGDLAKGIPAPTPGPGKKTPLLKSQHIFWLKYAGLFLVLMSASAALTWIILERAERTSLNSDAPAITPSQGGDAADRTSGARAAGPTQGGTPQVGRSGNDDAVLTAALGDWVAATNSRDVEKQMSYYAPKLDNFYRRRNVSSRAVRNEKARLFGRAREVQISTSEPEIAYGGGSDLTASMRFRKVYLIDAGRGPRRGEVIQELVWRKAEDGWKIVSERDVRVIK